MEPEKFRSQSLVKIQLGPNFHEIFPHIEKLRGKFFVLTKNIIEKLCVSDL